MICYELYKLYKLHYISYVITIPIPRMVLGEAGRTRFGSSGGLESMFSAEGGGSGRGGA